MNTANQTHLGQATLLKQDAVQAPWELYRLPISAFPAPDAEVELARRFLQRLTTTLENQLKLSIEVFIQSAQAHLGDAADRLFEHEPQWKTKLGFGVWPDRPAPTVWTREDFENLDVGEMPRKFMYHVLRVSQPREAKESARNVMLGCGTILQTMSPQDGDALLAAWREFLLPTIADRSLRGFQFYVPLLQGSSFSAAPATLDRWLGSAQVYIRESVEDNGILIASRNPLSPLLKVLGGETLTGEEWEIPIKP